MKKTKAKAKRKRFVAPKTVKEIFVRARRMILVDDGWCQGSFERLDGACCAVGALRRATFGDTAIGNARKQASDLYSRAIHTAHLQMAQMGEFGRIVSWNDAQGRTKQQVLGLFRRAIGAAG